MPKTPSAKAEYEIVFFADASSLEDWYSNHHRDTPGIWLKIAKKDSGIPSVNYAQALDAALIYGWIDGMKKSFDANHWLQKFTPRGRKSLWSQINRDKIDVLVKAGRMQEAGLAEVKRAKEDGRWDAAYAGQKSITVPIDFAEALDSNKKAKAFFETLKGANRFAILFRLHNAKKAETRTRKIAEYVAMLERGETIHG